MPNGPAPATPATITAPIAARISDADLGSATPGLSPVTPITPRQARLGRTALPHQPRPSRTRPPELLECDAFEHGAALVGHWDIRLGSLASSPTRLDADGIQRQPRHALQQSARAPGSGPTPCAHLRRFELAGSLYVLRSGRTHRAVPLVERDGSGRPPVVSPRTMILRTCGPGADVAKPNPSRCVGRRHSGHGEPRHRFLA